MLENKRQQCNCKVDRVSKQNAKLSMAKYAINRENILVSISNSI